MRSVQVLEDAPMTYEPVIGVEIHVQLNTPSKLFCGCRAQAFAQEPNTQVCPVCLGLPGALPAVNRRAVEYTVMLGLALHCQVAPRARFARKHYSYPDLVKGFQISMYDRPLCRDGWIALPVNGARRRARIARVHLEEETGRSIHLEGQTRVDYNRAGLPLAEVVTEPDFRSPDEVAAYMHQMQQLVRYLEISSGDMDKGALRFEVNLSLRPAGSEALGTKVELKNLNSFRAVLQAIAYEVERQRLALDRGESLAQETRGWDEERAVTVPQRSKEYAADYRYFPEPDLPPLPLEPPLVDHIRAQLPELPWARRDRFVEEYGLRPYDAALLTEERAVADYYERAIAETVHQGVARRVSTRVVAHWVTGELFRLLKERDVPVDQLALPPALLVELIDLVEGGEITAGVGKALLEEVLERGVSPRRLVERRGLARIASPEELAPIVDQVIADHAGVVEDYLGGKETAVRYLIGRVMEATGGRADPRRTAELLREQLEVLRSGG